MTATSAFGGSDKARLERFIARYISQLVEIEQEIGEVEQVPWEDKAEEERQRFQSAIDEAEKGVSDNKKTEAPEENDVILGSFNNALTNNEVSLERNKKALAEMFAEFLKQERLTVLESRKARILNDIHVRAEQLGWSGVKLGCYIGSMRSANRPDRRYIAGPLIKN